MPKTLSARLDASDTISASITNVKSPSVMIVTGIERIWMMGFTIAFITQSMSAKARYAAHCGWPITCAEGTRATATNDAMAVASTDISVLMAATSRSGGRCWLFHDTRARRIPESCRYRFDARMCIDLGRIQLRARTCGEGIQIRRPNLYRPARDTASGANVWRRTVRESRTTPSRHPIPRETSPAVGKAVDTPRSSISRSTP